MDKFEEWFVSQYFYTNMRFVHGDALFDKDGDFFRILAVQIAWEAWQSRQAELVDKDQRIHELNETSLDLEGQIYKLQEQLNEKDKRIESLIAQIEMSDFKDSLGHELKSNLAYLDLKALRGEHE